MKFKKPEVVQKEEKKQPLLTKLIGYLEKQKK